MGFLKTFGRPLDWEESKQHIEVIRKDALTKIIDWITSTQKLSCHPKFGFEVEIF